MDDNNAYYFYYYGSVLHKVYGNLNEAEEIYNKGHALDSDNINILTGLINLYLEKKDANVDKGEKDEDIDKEDVDKKTEAYEKAWRYYCEAVSLLEEQIKQKPDALTLLQLGELNLVMEEYDEAKNNLVDSLENDQALVKALKEEDAIVTFYTDLGVLYTHEGNDKKAVEYFAKAVKRDNHNLTLRSILADAYLNAKNAEKAEAEYKKILEITDCHVVSQIGLGEVYNFMGDKEVDGMYEQAIRHFDRGIRLANSNNSSERLRKKALAAAYYSRGYARVKLCKENGDEDLLTNALDDFKECFYLDPGYHKAKRAAGKLEKRLRYFSPQRFTDKIGPFVILVPSFTILFLSICKLFFTKSHTTGTKNAETEEAESTGLVSKFLNIDVKSNATYVALTFGALAFIIVSLYLPQILKFKIAGIEIEKGSFDQITSTKSLEIEKGSVGLITPTSFLDIRRTK